MRVVTIEGNPWFVAADVRRVLGIVQSGTNYTFLSPDEIRPVPSGQASSKGMGRAVIVSESGLYKLIMRSDKPQARAFQDWVTRDVLPSIRKDGMYVLGDMRRGASRPATAPPGRP